MPVPFFVFSNIFRLIAFYHYSSALLLSIHELSLVNVAIRPPVLAKITFILIFLKSSDIKMPNVGPSYDICAALTMFQTLNELSLIELLSFEIVHAPETLRLPIRSPSIISELIGLHPL